MDLEFAFLEDQFHDIEVGSKSESLDFLKSVYKYTGVCSEDETKVIMDFLSKDPTFKSLTRGSVEGLYNTIQPSLERETVGSVLTLLLLGFDSWEIWHWVDSKTVVGLNDWVGRHGATAVDPEMFEERARVPNYSEFASMQQGITRALPILAKLVDGKLVSDQELAAASKSLGFNIDYSRFDDYAGHAYALLMASIKGLGVHVIASAAWIVVSIISLGLLYYPAALLAFAWAAIKTGTAYKRAYEEYQSSESLTVRGWNKPTFMAALEEFRKHYQAIKMCATRLDRLKGGEIYTPAQSAHAHAFTDLLLMDIKVEARVLGTVVAAIDKILSVQINH